MSYKLGSMIVAISFFLVACVESKQQSWQGTFYPRGCLDCGSSYVYSPVFKTFEECKNWADSKIKTSEDKASCGRSCKFEEKMDMSKCDLVVRSWHISLLPDSPTFTTYKEVPEAE